MRLLFTIIQIGRLAKLNVELGFLEKCCRVYLISVPFADALSLSLHFVKHGHKFGAATEQEYEQMADRFMSQVLHPDLHECIKASNLDRIRLEGATRYFGVAYNVLTIRTFHVRDTFSIAHGGGPAGFVAHKCAER